MTKRIAAIGRTIKQRCTACKTVTRHVMTTYERGTVYRCEKCGKEYRSKS